MRTMYTRLFVIALLMIGCGLECHQGVSVPAQAAKYNITASHQEKFVWFRVAKVGTRTIINILRNHTQLSVDGYNVPFKPVLYRPYFKFVFVRNPWDRVVSTYCNKVLTRKHKPFQSCFGKSFAHFVNFLDGLDLSRADAHIRLQTTLFPKNNVDFIGRFENFEDDLRHVLSVLGLDDVEIPHANASTHDHYSLYYTERTRKIIARKYKSDIDAFGYTFEAY